MTLSLTNKLKLSKLLLLLSWFFEKGTSRIVLMGIEPDSGLHFDSCSVHVHVVVPVSVEALVARSIEIRKSSVGEKSGPMSLHYSSLHSHLLCFT